MKEKNQFHTKPSLTWESTIGVASLRDLLICVSFERRVPPRMGSSTTIFLSHLFLDQTDLRLCLFYVNLQRKKERQGYKRGVGWFFRGLVGWLVLGGLGILEERQRENQA